LPFLDLFYRIDTWYSRSHSQLDKLDGIEWRQNRKQIKCRSQSYKINLFSKKSKLVLNSVIVLWLNYIITIKQYNLNWSNNTLENLRQFLKIKDYRIDSRIGNKSKAAPKAYLEAFVTLVKFDWTKIKVKK